MVNYARMETVWRSYGPLEPIGPYGSKPRRRPARAIAAGLAVICSVGAAAGLYLRPDLDAQAESRPTPRTAEERPVVRANAPSPAEAARLQAELQYLVLEGGQGGAAVATEPASAPEYPIASVAPQVTRPDFAAAAPRSQAPVTVARSRAPVASAQAPARRPAAAAPARARVPDRPILLASRAPTPLVLPRATPRLTPVAPAPSPVAAAESAGPARAPEPQGPSYECGSARTAAERMVCASAELAALDRNMAAELDAAVASGHSARELARDQASWRKRREGAAPDPRAVADLYRQRIGQLRSMQ